MLGYRFDTISLYGHSFLSFYKGEFEKCINYGNRVNQNDFALRLGISKVALKAMYELCHFDSAKSYLVNYRHYLIHNKSISKNITSRELLFTDHYFILLKNLKPSGKGYLKNIIKKLGSEIIAADKEWLLSKLREMESRAIWKNLQRRNPQRAGRLRREF